MAALAAAMTIGLVLPAHHADDGFRNVPYVERAGIDVALPFFLRMIGRRVWSAAAGTPPAVVANDGAWLRENARHSEPSVTWIGHASVLVQMDHVTFLTDPIWSDTASPVSFAGPRRFVPPGLPLTALPPIDFVVVSHSHYDHLDVATLRALSNGTTRFLVPLRLGDVLRDAGVGPVEELDWWESRTIRGVEVTCVPAQHWSQRTAFDKDRTLWGGWVVRGASRRFWFAGDTGYFGGFAEIGRRLGPFDLVALPIGAYAPAAMMRPFHMDPEEAFQAALDVRATRLLGVHWGTFELTEEPIDEPARRLHAEAARRGVEDDRVWTLPVGETRRW